MKALTNGTAKFFISNFAIVVVIAALPIFLISSDIQAYNKFINYLFNNNI